VAKFPPNLYIKSKFDCKSSQIYLSFFGKKSNIDSVDMRVATAYGAKGVMPAPELASTKL